jgi:hypothetical protein
MLATREQAKRARSLTERLVTKHREKVKTFERFTAPDLGVEKTINPMEILETGPNGEKDPVKATKCAILMENFLSVTRAQYASDSLEETSRASLPAWVKNGLALIAAAQADDITDKVISVQPMSNRLGRIHYLDVVTERAKGQIPDRAKMFDALNGFRGTQDFSSENIENEVIGPSGVSGFNVTFGYGPVIPGTVKITDGTQVITDDKNGNLVGDVAAPGGGFTNSIDYLTRQASFIFVAPAGSAVRASYQYNVEAALMLPEYGILLRAENVQARPRALGASWSQQSVIDFLNDFGIDAEPTIVEAGARLIAMETFKHVVNTLRQNATGGAVIFDNTAPTGVSYRDHLKTFALYISRLQDLIWESTQVVRPNVLVIHPSILFAIAFQDGFEGVKFSNDGIAGPRYVGRLTKHDIDVFADPTFYRDQGVLTHRGAEFVSTAAVKGEYVPLYKAPVHVRGFRKDFALLSEYVIKIINSNQIGTLQVINL